MGSILVGWNYDHCNSSRYQDESSVWNLFGSPFRVTTKVGVITTIPARLFTIFRFVVPLWGTEVHRMLFEGHIGGNITTTLVKAFYHRSDRRILKLVQRYGRANRCRLCSNCCRNSW